MHKQKKTNVALFRSRRKQIFFVFDIYYMHDTVEIIYLVHIKNKKKMFIYLNEKLKDKL